MFNLFESPQLPPNPPPLLSASEWSTHLDADKKLTVWFLPLNDRTATRPPITVTGHLTDLIALREMLEIFDSYPIESIVIE